MQSISAQELKAWLDQGKNFQLVDVRENDEYIEHNMKGELIPMGDVLRQAYRISKDREVVIHCRSGKRSAIAIDLLKEVHPYDNLYNLEGGILAWDEFLETRI